LPICCIMLSITTGGMAGRVVVDILVVWSQIAKYSLLYFCSIGTMR
jgi:hypothetical protein